MIEEILQQTRYSELLIKEPNKLLIKERKRTDIVIGAPHHGRMRVPNNPDRKGDTNVGFIAWKIAEQLEACSIIACNYRTDPNKKLDSCYSKQIKKWKPKYLIEIHGHGGINASYDIEISSGKVTKKRNENSIKFATTLKDKMDKYADLDTYTISGDFGAIFFKAEKSATITTEEWIPFHIELPPGIRKDRNNRNELPAFIDNFTTCLKDTIGEICK